jgi:hypothetical protein
MQYGATLAPPGVTAGTVGVRDIPYDYVTTFRLTGEPARRVQDVITVSSEGTFVAVSVGYSFLPSPRAIAVPELTGPPDLKVNGVAVGPGSPFAILAGLSSSVFASSPALAGQIARSIFVREVTRLAGFDFKYSIVDSGSGRELQNQAIHNIAGLGAGDGERPFRPLAKAAPFAPRSTIRIEVEEISEGPFYRDGTLYLVLHGYKRLGE